MNFDAVFSIRGQSLLDGLWRILQPALPPLESPLPLTVPGMANSSLAIRSMVPELKPNAQGAATLVLHLRLEARGDAILAATATLGVAQVPIAVPFTAPTDLIVEPSLSADVTLKVTAESPLGPPTFSGLFIRLGEPSIDWSLAEMPWLEAAKASILKQLTDAVKPGGAGLQLTVLGALNVLAENFAKSAKSAIEAFLTEALTDLTARTGRLIFPPATNAPCDFALVPHEALAQVVVSGNQVILQVGFATVQKTIPKPPQWPDFKPAAGLDTRIDVSNQLVLNLLCCLIEKLPNFAFRGQATFSETVEMETGIRRSCCKWDNVILDLWPVTCYGSLQLCIVKRDGSTELQIIGSFEDRGSVLVINVDFTLRLAFELNQMGALSGLRLLPSSIPDLAIRVDLNDGVKAALAAAALGGFMVPAIPILVSLVPLVVSQLQGGLQRVIQTLLDRAHALASPPAVPPGLFEAFGQLVPANIQLDDLVVSGVLATPTAPWALRPLHLLPKPLALAVPAPQASAPEAAGPGRPPKRRSPGRPPKRRGPGRPPKRRGPGRPPKRRGPGRPPLQEQTT